MFRKNMNKINIAIVGVGNCSSSLIQGLEFYKNVNDSDELIPGLMHNSLGGYLISDIKPVAAFDVDRRKVGTDISKAIFSRPNCTKKFSDVPILNAEVMKGPIFDGVAPHMKDYFQVDENQKPVDVVEVLKESNVEILINYLPVGSQRVTEYYAQCAIEARCSFINCIPVFIASNNEWSNKFKDARLPIIGDDIKSQVGATIMNRYLVQMIQDRGGKISSIYQLNIGGNCDFLNMTSQDRLDSKKISKTESISSLIPYDSNNTKPYVYAGPNGFIECLSDNKICYLRIDFRIFGDVPCSMDCKLSVEDSPNSAGIVIDAIRMAKIAMDRKLGGALLGPSAWLMKHPPIQYSDNIAHQMSEDFIN